MLEFYWTLGRDISEKYSKTEIYGTQFFNRVSADLRRGIPNATGFSPQNLRYCQHFYELYSDVVNFPQVVGKSSAEAEHGLIDSLLAIPWGHHRFIIDKIKKGTEEAKHAFENLKTEISDLEDKEQSAKDRLEEIYQIPWQFLC